MAKKAYIGADNFTRRELPSGYTQVLYIESSGTQYIDSMFKPNQDTRVVLDFQVTSENSDLSANVVFGARSSASSKAFAVQWNTSNDNFQHFYNNGYDNLDFGKFDIRQILEMNKNVFSLNGETHTRTYASFQCAYTLYLFALNNAGTAAFYSKMRLYSCQIYDNSTLVRDFVPCYRDSDHAVGLYDMVQGTFYTNAGTGAFTCPLPPMELPQGYTQVTYIEATGTQYINTGFVANQDTSVTIDFEVTDTTATSWLFCGRKSSSADAYGVYAYKGGTSFYFMYGTERNNFAGDTTKRQICKVIKNQCSIGETTVTVAEQTFSSSVPLCLLVRNTNGTIETFATAKVYSCQIYDNGTLIRDYVPCLNASGTAGLYDMVNGVFYGNAGTGSFTVGAVYASGVARKIKRDYIGIDDVARRVKKAYIGIGGVARPCWGGGELAYYGTITALSEARSSLAATSIGNYALFGGGYDQNQSPKSTVDAYNKSLTRTTPTALSRARLNLAATSIGNYALFGGGSPGTGNGTTTVDAYNTSLTRTTPTVLYAPRFGFAATSVGDYALFGGGITGSSYSKVVDAYDKSLTRTTPTALSEARSSLAATSIGDFALFGGGKTKYSTSNVVDAYDKSLTRTTPTVLSTSMYLHAATSIGDFALFGGGLNYSSEYKVVDAYDKSLTRTTLTALSVERAYLSATSVSDFALFGGGLNDSSESKVVDAYDKSLTRTTPTALSEARSSLAATSIGDFALFGGGSNDSSDFNVVDAYVVS